MTDETTSVAEDKGLFDGFFEGLTKTLEASRAVTAEVPAEAPISADPPQSALAKQVAAIHEFLTGSGETSLVKMFEGVAEQLNGHSDVMDAALDRIAALEGGAVVRKSLSVDADSDGDRAPVAKAKGKVDLDDYSALSKGLMQAVKTGKPLEIR